MENGITFNLGEAIERWQRPLRASGAFTRDNLEELTGHLEDIYQANEKSEGTDERRFQAAVLQLGDPDALISAYTGTNERRLNREYLLFFLAGMVGFVGIAMCMTMLFSLSAFVFFGAGLQAFWMDAGLTSGIIIQILLLSLIARKSFQSINREWRTSRKAVRFRRRWLTLALCEFVGLLFLLVGPYLLLVKMGTGESMSVVSRETNFEHLLSFLTTAFVTWWIVGFILWLSWMIRMPVESKPGTYIKNNRVLFFAMGGLATILLHIMMRLTNLLLKVLVIQWGVNLEVASVILNMLQLLSMAPVLLAIFCFLWPQILAGYTRDPKPEVSRWLLWSAAALLLLFLTNEVLIFRLDTQADFTMVEAAIPTVMDQLFPLLLVVVLCFVLIRSYWLRKNGQVILTDS